MYKNNEFIREAIEETFKLVNVRFEEPISAHEKCLKYIILVTTPDFIIIACATEIVFDPAYTLISVSVVSDNGDILNCVNAANNHYHGLGRFSYDPADSILAYQFLLRNKDLNDIDSGDVVSILESELTIFFEVLYKSFDIITSQKSFIETPLSVLMKYSKNDDDKFTVTKNCPVKFEPIKEQVLDFIDNVVGRYHFSSKVGDFYISDSDTYAHIFDFALNRVPLIPNVNLRCSFDFNETTLDMQIFLDPNIFTQTSESYLAVIKLLNLINDKLYSQGRFYIDGAGDIAYILKLKYTEMDCDIRQNHIFTDDELSTIRYEISEKINYTQSEILYGIQLYYSLYPVIAATAIGLFDDDEDDFSELLSSFDRYFLYPFRIERSLI
jgi:hypothetical protein